MYGSGSTQAWPYICHCKDVKVTLSSLTDTENRPQEPEVCPGFQYESQKGESAEISES